MADNSKKIELDSFDIAYSDASPHILDTNLMLSWYPQRILGTSKGKSLLELGIGHGQSSEIFSKNFERHLILEGSQKVIDRFKNTHFGNHPEIINTLFEDFNTEEKFDLIVFGFVLEHVDNPLEILIKYSKFLSKDGTMFIIVPNGETIPRRIGKAAGIIDDMTYLTAFDRLLGHKRVFTVKTIRELVSSASLKTQEIEGLFLKTMTSEQYKLLKLPKNVLLGMMEVGVNYPELCVAVLLKVKV